MPKHRVRFNTCMYRSMTDMEYCCFIIVETKCSALVNKLIYPLLGNALISRYGERKDIQMRVTLGNIFSCVGKHILTHGCAI